LWRGAAAVHWQRSGGFAPAAAAAAAAGSAAAAAAAAAALAHLTPALEQRVRFNDGFVSVSGLVAAGGVCSARAAERRPNRHFATAAL